LPAEALQGAPVALPAGARRVREVGSHDAGPGDRSGAEATGRLRRPQEPDVVDHVPSRLGRKPIDEPRHGGPRDAVGHPPEEIARGVITGVLGGEVGGAWPEAGGRRAVAPAGEAVADRALGAVAPPAPDAAS